MVSLKGTDFCLQTVENEETFNPPLKAAFVRIVLKEPNEVPAIFGFEAEIVACYERFLSGQG